MAETRVAAQSVSQPSATLGRSLDRSIDRRGRVGHTRSPRRRPAWCGIRCRVSKKVAEFLGEEEKTLIDFIIDKVEQHSPPSAIAEELQDVLEKDAEMFTIKMWRVLLFELIQARPSVRVFVPWALCVPGMAGGSDCSTHRSNRPTLNPPAALRPPTRVLACQTPPARSVTVGCNSGADRARVLSMRRPASRRGRSSWMSLRRASHLLSSKLVRRTQVACSARYRAIHGVTHPARTCVLKWGRAAVVTASTRPR